MTAEHQKNQKKRRSPMLKTLILAGTVLAASTFLPHVTARAADKVGVSYQPALFWALPFYIADKKGWWGEIGLDPNYSTFPSGAPQMAAAASGSWDVGGTGSAPAVLGAARFSIVTIGITNNESAGNALMARAADIAAIRADPKTLKGQRLLVTTNSTGEYAAAACIKSYGLRYPDDVEVVNLNQQQIISAFATGTGKIAGLWAPNIYTLESKAGAKLLCSGQDAGAIVPGALIARREYAEKNPDRVAKFLAVYLRGVNYIRNHKEEAVSMMGDFYALTGTELVPEYLEREIDTRPMFTLQEQMAIMDKAGGESKADKWFDELGNYLTATGTLDKPLKASTYIDPQYMRRVAETPALAAFANRTD